MKYQRQTGRVVLSGPRTDLATNGLVILGETTSEQVEANTAVVNLDVLERPTLDIWSELIRQGAR